MLIYDKYTGEYYNVIPVKKIEEKIEEFSLKNLTICYASRSNGKTFQQAVRTEVINILQQLIKENTEEE